MAISATRLAELRAEFEKVKLKIDQIDRKYSLDYVEPTMDMPESLGLVKLEYTPKTEAEIMSQANTQVEAGYLSDIRRLENNYALDLQKLDAELLAIEERALAEQAKLLSEFNLQTANIRRKLIDNGMLYSSALSRLTQQLQEEYNSSVEQSNMSADNDRGAVEAERQIVIDNYNSSVASAEQERGAKAQTAYNKLLKSEYDERIRIEKYNNLLDEKENKYQMSRAKALEAARQAEYDRSYAAKKLYQQMGATGYEDNKQWEKYNVMVNHFSAFTKREEALVLVQGDSYVSNHLQGYYSTLVEWISRNIPA